MKTQCKVMTYNLSETSLSTIESDVEKHCNDSFFTEQSIVSCSTAMSNDDTENFVVTVIYEFKIKWLKLLVFLLIFCIFLTIGLTLFFYSYKNVTSV